MLQITPSLHEAATINIDISENTPYFFTVKLTSICQMISIEIGVETDQNDHIFPGHRNIFLHTSEVVLWKL
jgi:hypothetical protein